MAFGSKRRTSGHGEAELLRGLVNLASEIQSSPELDGIVRAIATTVTRTFGPAELSPVAAPAASSSGLVAALACFALPSPQARRTQHQ